MKDMEEVNWWSLLWAAVDVDAYNARRRTELERARSSEGGEKTAFLRVDQMESYLFGLAMMAIVFVIVAAIFKYALLINHIEAAWIAPTLTPILLILSFHYIYSPGVVSIRIGYRGNPTIFDTRLEGIIANEGKYWTPWFIMGLEEVNIKIQFSNVSESEVLDAEGLDWEINTDIIWLIEDPYKRLSTDVDDVEQAVEAATRSAVMHTIGELKTDEIRNQKNEKVADLVKEHATEHIKYFGGRVISVYFPKALPDVEYMEALREKKIEEAQRDAEIIETKHVAAMIAYIRQETGMSATEAQDLFQVERGKVSKNINESRISIDPATRKEFFETLRAIAEIIIKRYKS